jgi:hypothetical protein
VGCTRGDAKSGQRLWCRTEAVRRDASGSERHLGTHGEGFALGGPWPRLEVRPNNSFSIYSMLFNYFQMTPNLKYKT